MRVLPLSDRDWLLSLVLGRGPGSGLRRDRSGAQPVLTGYGLGPRGWGVLAACALLAGCQSRQIDNAMLVMPDEEVSFARDVLPIFTASCAECHVAERTSGVALGTYEQVTTSVGEQYGERVVVPGDAAGSPLLDKVGPSPRFGQRMPLGRGALAPDQIALIRTWIDDGALDN